MTRKTNTIPTYRKLTRKNRAPLAYVDIAGKRCYLGKYDSKESRQAYQRLLVELESKETLSTVGPPDITIVELTSRFLSWGSDYYRKHGKRTGEYDNLVVALRFVVNLYGRTKAAEFGPRALKTVRQAMIATGVRRGYINKNVLRVKKMFKWAVAEELLEPKIYQALQAVPGLKKGRCDAKEPEPVRTAPKNLIEAVKKQVSRQVAAMIELQLLTGARSGEVVLIRAIDIDTSGAVWIYRPSTHKTEHQGRERMILLGPAAQTVVRPFLQNRPVHAYLFSPAEAEAQRRVEMHRRRKTPLGYGNCPGSNNRNIAVCGDHYTTASYRRAIERGCRLAFPPPEPLAQRDDENIRQWRERLQRDGLAEALKTWQKEHYWHPHQLRHNYATTIRKQYGLKIAQILLGHSKADVTQIYAERDMSRALDVPGRIG